MTKAYLIDIGCHDLFLGNPLGTVASKSPTVGLFFQQHFHNNNRENIKALYYYLLHLTGIHRSPTDFNEPVDAKNFSMS